MLRGGLLFLFLTGLSLAAFAQDDDLMKLDSATRDTSLHSQRKDGKQVLPITSDSVKVTSDAPVKEIDSYAKRFNPRKASLYAMVFPGAGQIYVKKYWKVPLVWGGMGFMAYAVSFAAKQYRHYRFEYFETVNNPNIILADGLDHTRLATIVTEARRQRDYFLIINFFIYILQIVDAHVDAHLKEFDLNPNLHVSVESMSLPYASTGGVGLSVAYKF